MKQLIASLTILACTYSYAAGTATVVCEHPKNVLMGESKRPHMQITYFPERDVGIPGLLWLALVAPDESHGYLMTQRGWVKLEDILPYAWLAGEAGKHHFLARYDQGFPGTIRFTLGFHNNSTSTSAYVGYRLYVGHGALSDALLQKVKVRRDVLTAAKPDLVARGRWKPEYDDDSGYIHSLLQQDMQINKKYGVALTIPAHECDEWKNR